MAFAFRAPWTAAIVLLVLIWTVYFVRTPGSSSLAHVPNIATEQNKHNFEPGGLQGDEDAAPGIPELNTGKMGEAPTAPQGLTDPFDDTLGERTTTLKSAPPKPTPKKGVAEVKHTDRPLVTYVYAQTDSAEANLRYFIAHALNSAADFIFIINGEAKQALEIIPKKDNVLVVERENDCYDLGAHAEILTTKIEVDGKEMERWKSYKRFILLNASIRGPFMPNWSNVCWMDAYLSKLSDSVKLIGMTANCWPQFHVQSMIWGTDSAGLSLLLYPPQPATIPPGLPDDWKEVGINGCFHTWDEAVHAEVFSTQIIRDAGYEIAVMMSAFYSDENYIEHCDSGGNGDVLWNGKYFGTNVHPYETVFMKTNRDIDPVLIEKLTAWKSGENYTSYDHC